MLSSHLSVLETLSVIYEDLDLDKVEDKFITLVKNSFNYDRLALFFVKHKKNVIQGKLEHGFSAEQQINELQIPLKGQTLFHQPLISGFPYWLDKDDDNDEFKEMLGLDNTVLVPISNKKRVECWQAKNCQQSTCPAFGRKWLKCWQVPDTLCCDGRKLPADDKRRLCEQCTLFAGQDIEAMEGILLVDNTPSGRPIPEEDISILSLIAVAVGGAIDNSKLFQKTRNYAIRDELTQLHNRRYFNERLFNEMDRAKRYDSPPSLILCDIDHFKKINDTYGHPTGDDILVLLAAQLRTHVRRSDVVARYGGEEFAIILLNTEQKEALAIAENLRHAVQEAEYTAKDNHIRLTMSFGLATYDPHSNCTPEELQARADRALYDAKNRGRNRVCSA